ncbi:MAG: Hint domain-containing protein [Pseudomonadota bacterium]
MSEKEKKQEQKRKARRRFIGLSAGIAGVTMASSAQAGLFEWCFPKGNDPVPCFLKGTRIETQDGPVAIEDIKAGDLVKTISGSLEPVKWIGVSTTTVSQNEIVDDTVRPIRIAKDAIADGAPHTDLLVSPDHAMFIDGALVPAKYLVNGVTITQEQSAEWTEIAYYHLELEAHNVIIAEGAAAETYRAFENRSLFDDSTSAVDSKTIEAPYAPLLTMARRDMLAADLTAVVAPWAHRPSQLEQIRIKLADRADALTGFQRAA